MRINKYVCVYSLQLLQRNAAVLFGCQSSGPLRHSGTSVAQLEAAVCERAGHEAMWRNGPISRTPNQMECQGFLSRTSCFIWMRMLKSFLEQPRTACVSLKYSSPAASFAPRLLLMEEEKNGGKKRRKKPGGIRLAAAVILQSRCLLFSVLQFEQQSSELSEGN